MGSLRGVIHRILCKVGEWPMKAVINDILSEVRTDLIEMEEELVKKLDMIDKLNNENHEIQITNKGRVRCIINVLNDKFK